MNRFKSFDRSPIKQLIRKDLVVLNERRSCGNDRTWFECGFLTACECVTMQARSSSLFLPCFLPYGAINPTREGGKSDAAEKSMTAERIREDSADRSIGYQRSKRYRCNSSRHLGNLSTSRRTLFQWALLLNLQRRCLLPSN